MNISLLRISAIVAIMSIWYNGYYYFSNKFDVKQFDGTIVGNSYAFYCTLSDSCKYSHKSYNNNAFRVSCIYKLQNSQSDFYCNINHNDFSYLKNDGIINKLDAHLSKESYAHYVANTVCKLGLNKTIYAKENGVCGTSYWDVLDKNYDVEYFIGGWLVTLWLICLAIIL